jgi:hypothetical protein
MERVDQDPDQVSEGSENLGTQSAESGSPGTRKTKGDEDRPDENAVGLEERDGRAVGRDGGIRRGVTTGRGGSVSNTVGGPVPPTPPPVSLRVRPADHPYLFGRVPDGRRVVRRQRLDAVAERVLAERVVLGADVPPFGVREGPSPTRFRIGRRSDLPRRLPIYGIRRGKPIKRARRRPNRRGGRRGSNRRQGETD